MALEIYLYTTNDISASSVSDRHVWRNCRQNRKLEAMCIIAAAMHIKIIGSSVYYHTLCSTGCKLWLQRKGRQNRSLLFVLSIRMIYHRRPSAAGSCGLQIEAEIGMALGTERLCAGDI